MKTDSLTRVFLDCLASLAKCNLQRKGRFESEPCDLQIPLECTSGDYKVLTTLDIFESLPKHFRGNQVAFFFNTFI